MERTKESVSLTPDDIEADKKDRLIQDVKEVFYEDNDPPFDPDTDEGYQYDVWVESGQI